MRLLSQKSREYRNKEYRKFWIIIPNKIIEKLKWEQGDKLETEIIDDKLVIEKQ